MSVRLNAAIVLVILTASPVLADPPFQGTVFITPDIITSADPSAFTGATYTGRGNRWIFDYRPFEWINVNCYLFEARIHGRSIEFQVNPEFGSEEAARAEVDTYALALGRLPAVLLSRAENVHVSAGEPGHPDAGQRGRLGARVPKVFGGNYSDRSFTIHTGSGQRYQRGGFLEEVLFHEGGHVSLQNHQDAPGWHAAREADGEYISDYARRHPDREDVAESVLPYFALRHRPNRLSSDERAAIEDTIPNRIGYFDELALDWSPYTPAEIDPNRAPVTVGTLPDVRLPELHAALDVDVSPAFDDPDGDPLTYAVSSSVPQVVAVSAAGARVTLTARSVGTATVRVTATDPDGLSAAQSFMVTVTMPIVRAPFTDDPLRPGVTPVRAVHFTELRDRINALRVANGLGRFRWTDPALRAGATGVRLVHLRELRLALAAAYTAAGRPVPRWTDPGPVAGTTPIRAVHLTELRAAVVALEAD